MIPVLETLQWTWEEMANAPKFKELMDVIHSGLANVCHNPSCIVHDFQTGRVVHPGTSPPHLTPSLCASGAFVEDPDEAGGVTIAKCSVLALTLRPQWHSIDTRGWRPQMQTPLTPACSQRQSISHDSHHGGTVHPSQVGVH